MTANFYPIACIFRSISTCFVSKLHQNNLSCSVKKVNKSGSLELSGASWGGVKALNFYMFAPRDIVSIYSVSLVVNKSVGIMF